MYSTYQLKLTMKKFALIAVAAAALLTVGACTSKTSTDADSATETVVNADLTGSWEVTKIEVARDSVIRPAEVDSAATTAFQFRADNTFGVTTNCNSIGGTYHVTGDSVVFDNLYSTRMACPDMSIEMALSEILPQVKTVKMHDDDSTAKLETGGHAYIDLRKIVEPNDTTSAQ